MTLKANEKIKLVLERILEEHSLGKENPTSVNVPIYDLTYDSKIEDRNIESIFEHLEDRGMLVTWFLKDDESYDLLCKDDFRDKAKVYLGELEQTDLPVKLEESNIKVQFVEDKGSLYVLVKGKRARLSDDVNTKKAKLVSILSTPHIGISRTIDTVVEAIKLPRDRYDEYTDKKKIITETFKDVNRTLKSERSPVRFRSKIKNGSVSMVVDERKSG